MTLINQKSFRLFIIIVLFSNYCFSQSNESKKSNKGKKDSNPPQSLHLQAYQNALQIGDFRTAIVALNYFLLEEPTNENYKDTLALLYVQTNQYSQSYILVKQLQESGRKSNLLTEVLAISANELNQTIEATDAYQTLYANTRNIQYGYALLQLQQQLKRVNEALMTCNQLLSDTAINVASINLSNKNGEREASVPLKAVLLNINGLLAYENKDYNASINSFKEAIALAPSYDIAVQNLKTITAVKESMEKVLDKKAN